MATEECPDAADSREEQVVRAALRWIGSALPLMLLALVLAALAWVVAVEEEDPAHSIHYSKPNRPDPGF